MFKLSWKKIFKRRITSFSLHPNDQNMVIVLDNKEIVLLDVKSSNINTIAKGEDIIACSHFNKGRDILLLSLHKKIFLMNSNGHILWETPFKFEIPINSIIKSIKISNNDFYIAIAEKSIITGSRILIMNTYRDWVLNKSIPGEIISFSFKQNKDEPSLLIANSKQLLEMDLKGNINETVEFVDTVEKIRISPGGNHLLQITEDRKAIKHDLIKKSYSSIPSDTEIVDANISADGKFIGLATGKKIILLDSQLHRIWEYLIEVNIDDILPSLDGKVFYVFFDSNSIIKLISEGEILDKIENIQSEINRLNKETTINLDTEQRTLNEIKDLLDKQEYQKIKKISNDLKTHLINSEEQYKNRKRRENKFEELNYRYSDLKDKGFKSSVSIDDNLKNLKIKIDRLDMVCENNEILEIENHLYDLEKRYNTKDSLRKQIAHLIQYANDIFKMDINKKLPDYADPSIFSNILNNFNDTSLEDSFASIINDLLRYKKCFIEMKILMMQCEYLTVLRIDNKKFLDEENTLMALIKEKKYNDAEEKISNIKTSIQRIIQFKTDIDSKLKSINNIILRIKRLGYKDLDALDNKIEEQQILSDDDLQRKMSNINKQLSDLNTLILELKPNLKIEVINQEGSIVGEWCVISMRLSNLGKISIVNIKLNLNGAIEIASCDNYVTEIKPNEEHILEWNIRPVERGTLIVQLLGIYEDKLKNQYTLNSKLRVKSNVVINKTPQTLVEIIDSVVSVKNENKSKLLEDYLMGVSKIDKENEGQ